MKNNFLANFLRLESSAGIILFFSAILAVVFKNSPFSGLYDSLIASGLTHWVNDGLMCIFFFVVGLEIKREFVSGELSSKQTALLPVIAALGGMLFPAIVYILITRGSPELARGWAIPCATDIAFSLGILSLLGNRIKPSLKVFLTALAIIDDLGAIVIIAFFYTANLNSLFLLYSGLACAAMLALNMRNVTSKLAYAALGILLWYLVLKSGIHATVAGVVAAMFVPYKTKGEPPLTVLEKMLHPYVAFLILPIFAFFNSGISLGDIDTSVLFSSLTLGITLGLFLGKQLGVMILSWLAIKINFSRLPTGVNWKEFYGVSILTGVGFTMSLFIDHLAFSEPSLAVPSKVGILTGSILSGVFGYLIIYFATSRKNH